MLAVIHEDYPKIRDVIDKNQIEGLLNFIPTILGIKFNSQDDKNQLDRQMILVLDLIKSKFSTLTIPEIREAFKMYVAHELPNTKVFRVVDCIAVAEVLVAYMEFRSESLRVYDQKKTMLELPQKQLSEMEERENRLKFLKIIFDEVKSVGYSHDAHRLFLELEKKGFINIKPEDKRIIYEQELKKYIPKKKEELRGRGVLGSAHLIKEFMIDVESDKPLTAVVNICRANAVSDFISKIETFEELVIKITI